MWENIERMFGDTLWIYTAIGGSILGALFIAYMRDTKVAMWAFGKWDTLIDNLVEKYDWTWLTQDPNAWKKVNPNIARKIDQQEARIIELEDVSHSPVAPGGTTELKDLIAKVESRLNDLEKEL